MTDTLYTRNLNPAQLEAVTVVDGPVLVIAGAGSGKTRTIVYRLAYLADQGVPPSSILLLTFTRKASQEMLHRASMLRGTGDKGLIGVTGGTFHSFAFGVLRRFAGAQSPDGRTPDNRVTIMDQADAEGVIRDARDRLKIAKGDRSFPRRGTVLQLISKSRNKERLLEDVITDEAAHLMPYAEDMARLTREYTVFKAEHGLFDYDDLLFEFERLLTDHAPAAEYVRQRFSHLMVDEYQDTNLVQARLVRLIAGETANVMAVGDDAQSIYAFRGAQVQNILGFPDMFPGTKLVRLEQNYRSTQPILDLTNGILAQAQAQFKKHLFSQRTDGARPQLIRTMSDRTQAKAVVNKVLELARARPMHEVAVLFRAGYQSYSLELALNKVGIKYRKYGGMRFNEAAHVKDALAWLRLVRNPADLPAWGRVLEHVKGVGPKTCAKVHAAAMAGDEAFIRTTCKRLPGVAREMAFIDGLRTMNQAPAALLETVLEHYRPILEQKHPDDYPKRQAGLEQLHQIAMGYPDLEAFLADISLESPDDDVGPDPEDRLVLSTVHSAKGLEWGAVCIIDMVEDRFPSRHAMNRAEDLEEERRLLYVACTRARDALCMFVPGSIYNQYSQMSEPVAASPFIADLPEGSFELWRENWSGVLSRVEGDGRGVAMSAMAAGAPEPLADIPTPAPTTAWADPTRLGYCTHRIFGRGKIIAAPGPDKYRVNFPGFGVKTILADYLELE